MESACCVFDAAVFNYSRGQLVEILKKECKSWCYQLEECPTTKNQHFQLRFSLKTKLRPSQCEKEWMKKYKIKPSPTSGENRDNYFYVMKEDTRLEGPFTERDDNKYIPKQFRIEKLYDYQHYMSIYIFDPRKVNAVICKQGSKGKSTIAHITRLTKNGVVLPPVNDAEKLVQSCCDILMAKNLREEIIIFIDLPRALGKDRLYGLYTAIEQVKTGYVYDVRHSYKEWDFDSPTIWVFTNTEPERELLSSDRWEVWDMKDDGEYPYIQNRRSGARI